MIPPTSTSTSLFAQLRALVPPRPLSFSEALRITELQANRCRQLLGFHGPAFPESAIADLPRIRLIEVDNLPSSAVSQWHNGAWNIAVDADEPWQRQRFSTGHELWHIINHTTGQWLHGTDQRRAEQLADYFSGCLYIPKQHLKRLVGEGLTATGLADTFGMSIRAVNVRLSQIGLLNRPRCASSFRGSPEWRRRISYQFAHGRTYKREAA